MSRNLFWLSDERLGADLNELLSFAHFEHEVIGEREPMENQKCATLFNSPRAEPGEADACSGFSQPLRTARRCLQHRHSNR
jgi:hypothetical protein